MPSAHTWDTSTAISPDAEHGEPVEETYVLEVKDGPEKGTRCTLGGGELSRVLAGKGPACELRLTDPQISRRHAAFEVTPQGLRVTDLDSTNGTTVNGVRVVDAFVAAGDRVKLGNTWFKIERGSAQPISMSADDHFGRMLGASEVMRRLYPRCRQLAESGLATLIEGETGTGKEVLAEALHEASPRAKAPFVVFDCTAVPPNLAESMLFGHEKGSFTGAVASRKGVFEEAHGGTLFIDEIGELDYAMQPKLLRALERSEVQRVGANKWTKVDVRIIAATRRDLDREVQAGRFRDDLFFRLAVGRIELPPLRKRKGDIEILARFFWQRQGGQEFELARDIIDRFEDYAWPGNVRELSHAVARVRAFGGSAVDDMGVLERGGGGQPDPEPTGRANVFEEILASGLPLTQARERLVSAFEQRYVEQVLAAHGGNVIRAAAASGLARRYFQILHARYKNG
jgi:two-component system, NtrC family, response regulator HydG